MDKYRCHEQNNMTAEIFPGLSRNEQLLFRPTTAVKCDKPDCYFCQHMIGIKSAYFKPIRKQPITKQRHWYPWLKSEIDLLLANMNTIAKDIELPGRSLGAIKGKKSMLRKIHHIKQMPRNYNQYGFC